MRRHRSPMLIAVLALSVLTGCGAAKDPSGNPPNSSAGDEKVAAVPAGDQADNGASKIGVDQPDPSKAIFSKEFALPGKTQRKVKVGILSLARQGQVLMLKVVVTPQFADKSAGETTRFLDALDTGYWEPTLLDLKNLKKYKVLAGTGSDLHFQDGKGVNGQPIYGWAAFAPPPTGVKSLDLTMADWMPRFTNVPIG